MSSEKLFAELFEFVQSFFENFGYRLEGRGGFQIHTRDSQLVHGVETATCGEKFLVAFYRPARPLLSILWAMQMALVMPVAYL